MAKYFGTDGIRGRFGPKPLDIEFALRVGNAVGRTLVKKGGSVVIGRDTRISGETIETAVSAGLQAAGVAVQLAGIMPSPGVALLTRKYKADLGIVISASHNPYYDNGIKFFNAQGGKLSDKEQSVIEQAIDAELVTMQDTELGNVSSLFTAHNDYFDFALNSISHVSLNGLRVAVDAGHGAMYRVAPQVFAELGATLSVIGVEPNGQNINAECGSTHTAALEELVKIESLDIGFSFDGDGDRLVVVDHLGETVDGDELLFILATYAHKQQALSGPVVGTSMSNMGLEMAFQDLGIEFERARVGDKHILEKLAATGGRFGGETSGHLICLDHATTGDGLIAALQLVKIVQQTGKSVNELKKGFKKYPQVIVNVKVKEKRKALDHANTQAAVLDAQTALAGMGRIVLRASGTEPVVRVMVEAESAGLTERYANEIADAIKGLSL